MQTPQSKTWLITGASSGLGKALAQAALHRGDFVFATFRKREQMADFQAQNPDKGMGLYLELNDRDTLAKVVSTVQQHAGRLDVLVNNAGFGFAGAIEEAADEEWQAVFDTNFFGPMRLTQALLPLFRRQGSGHIIQISSHGGFRGFAGFGVYNASKFALEGASEALAAEVAPLGIQLTIVQPGPFRTGFAGSSLRQARKRISAYDATAGVFRSRLQQVNGQQEGDPAKAALAILQIADTAQPPLRLVLGQTAVTTITTKLESVRREMELWSETSLSTAH